VLVLYKYIFETSRYIVIHAIKVLASCVIFLKMFIDNEGLQILDD